MPSGSHTDVVDAPAPDADAVALKHLWARQRIAQLGDEEALMGGQTQREPITALGLKYGLLTHYTSFIAVDQVVRTQAPAVPVNQPLPLPEGVSKLAVGEGAQQTLGAVVPSTPEPRLVFALMLMALLGIRAVVAAPRERRALKERCRVARTHACPAARCGWAPSTGSRCMRWRCGRTALYLAQRAVDGSDDPLGLLALAAVAAWVVWHRHGLRLTPRIGWLVASMALALAANGAWWVGVPALSSSLLAALSLVCALFAWWPAAQPRAPLAGLVVLALPWIASLQFYLGFPLRVVTAQLSAWGLQLAGYDAARSGASMVVNGQLVIVDAPCSGVQMAWLGVLHRVRRRRCARPARPRVRAPRRVGRRDRAGRQRAAQQRAGGAGVTARGPGRRVARSDRARRAGRGVRRGVRRGATQRSLHA